MCIDYARSTEKLQLCDFSVAPEVEVKSCRAQLQMHIFVCLAEFEAENFPGRTMDVRTVHVVLSRPYPGIIGAMYGVQATGY